MTTAAVLEPQPITVPAALLEQALTLPARDRRELVALLSQSLEMIDPDDPEYLIADQCLKEYRANPTKVREWVEVMAELDQIIEGTAD